MVSSDHRLGFYIVLPLYFALVGASAIWAYRKEARLEKSLGQDPLSAHFLGGRSFGPVITASTIFASFFSGYTVVGVPSEAYNKGFFALRWIVSSGVAIGAYSAVGLRLRRAATIRAHTSPSDFITDRYQSQLLRYTIVSLQLVPAVFYLAAQVTSLQTTFNGVFDIDSANPFPTIGIFFLILVFEWTGGLLSVAVTDVVQAFYIVIAFALTAVVVKKNFGGWADIDVDTFPRQFFYQTPTSDQQWQFWQFNLGNIGFFTLPHLMQRIYTARDLNSLRCGWAALAIGPWLTMFVGVFMGTIGVVILGGEKASNPASVILEVLMDLGGFAKFSALMIWTATIAAIMSTADSLMIAISHLVATEIIYPMNSTTSPMKIVWMGRVASLMGVVVALMIGITWTGGVARLSKIQFPLSLMAFPSFIFGLYSTSQASDIHPWSLTFGALTGVTFVVFYFFLYQDGGINIIPMDSSMAGLSVNLVAIAAAEVFRLFKSRAATEPEQESRPEQAVISIKKKQMILVTDRPTWDMPKVARFGECKLTPEMLWKSMEGVHEPAATLWYPFLMFLLVTIVTPLVPASEPAFNELGQFVSAPAVIRGIPWWAFKIIMTTAVMTFIVLYNLYKMPSTFYTNEMLIDPELIEMKVEELTCRRTYDERNEMIRKRRMFIASAQKAYAANNEDV
jgi:sodium/proline symporter